MLDLPVQAELFPVEYNALPVSIEQSNAIMTEFFSHQPDMEDMEEIEKYMLSDDFAKHVNNPEPIHRFSDGMYVRELTIPAGILIIGKRHAKGHVTFLMKGKATIVNDETVQTLEGPVGWVDEPGVKRAVYAHSDATFVTIHRTDKTTLPEIEAELMLKEDL